MRLGALAMGGCVLALVAGALAVATGAKVDMAIVLAVFLTCFSVVKFTTLLDRRREAEANGGLPEGFGGVAAFRLWQLYKLIAAIVALLAAWWLTGHPLVGT